MIQEHERIHSALQSNEIKAQSISVETPAVLETENLSTEPVAVEADNSKQDDVEITESDSTSYDKTEICAYFEHQLRTLTATEKSIYNLHIEKKTSKEIMSLLNIKENTLKYHNKNIYGKLGVSSRKQLIELSKQLEQ